MVFLRLLGGIYFIAFFSLAHQLQALIGENGLLPADLYLERIRALREGSNWKAFLTLPTLFLFNGSDCFMQVVCHTGVILSVLLLCGYSSALLLALLWFLYMSFVHVGQLFYGYAWEILLLETGFLAIFLCPLLKGGWFPRRVPVSKIVVWFYRWLAFRVMFGAGLIKIRGDLCWQDLTCLIHHYETQPIPHLLSCIFINFQPGFIKRVFCGTISSN